MGVTWQEESGRAVGYMRSRGEIPAGAAELVRARVLAELAELERALGVVPVVDDPRPMGSAWDEVALAEWLEGRVSARNANSAAMWREAEGELAPMDAALVRRLRELGSTKAEAEEKHALSPAARMPTGAASLHWRTTHKGGFMFAPAGESWPPEVAEHATFPLVGLAEGEREGGWRVERVEDSFWRGMPEDIEEQLATLSRAAALRAGDDHKALVKGYVELVRAADWSAAWVPPRRLVVLARALWEFGGLKDEWGRIEERRKKAGLAPTLHPVVQRVAAWPAMGELRQNGSGHDLVLADGRGLHLGWLPPAASVVLADGQLGEGVSELAPALLAWMVREVWRRYQTGDESRIVEVPASFHGLSAVLGTSSREKLNEAMLDDTLEWLSGVSLTGTPDASGRTRDPWPLVERWSVEQRQGAAGGRAAKVRVVHVGWPLVPWALAERLKEMRVNLPKELRFASGALDPAAMPVVGDKRTRLRQRAALALGLPAYLMRRRDEYAERGGLPLLESAQLGAWEKFAAEEWGLYVRTNASLPRKLMLAASGLHRKAPTLPGMSGAILEETAPGSGLWRMADEGQHGLILAAAGVSADARRRRARGKKAAERAKKPGGGRRRK